ncbi:MAG TPA: hypothetical protein VIT00_03170 [Terrimicrobiaceae bacterium]
MTDVVIDPAGNVWCANNWNSPEAVLGEPPPYPISTWGSGSGFTVIYGPGEALLMGQVRT